MDPDSTFLAAVIKEQHRAQKSYTLLAIALMLVAISVFAFSVGLDVKTYTTAAGTLLAFVGTIPIKIVFAVRAQELHYRYLNDSLKVALASGNVDGLTKVQVELAGIRTDILKKPWWG